MDEQLSEAERLFETELRLLDDLGSALRADYDFFVGRLYRREYDQAEARATIRAIMAYIEGTAYTLRQTTLRFYPPFGPFGRLSDFERAALAEQAFEISDQGHVVLKERASFERLTKMLRLSFHLYAKAHAGKYDLPVGEHGWGHLLQAIKKRNALAHPKHPADLAVSEDDLVTAIRAMQWYEQKIRDLMTASVGGMMRFLPEHEREGVREVLRDTPFDFLLRPDSE